MLTDPLLQDLAWELRRLANRFPEGSPYRTHLHHHAAQLEDCRTTLGLLAIAGLWPAQEPQRGAEQGEPAAQLEFPFMKQEGSDS